VCDLDCRDGVVSLDWSDVARRELMSKFKIGDKVQRLNYENSHMRPGFKKQTDTFLPILNDGSHQSEPFTFDEIADLLELVYIHEAFNEVT
jgi:hypothetical protein